MSNDVLADPWDILIGLRPELVRALANLAGSTQGDLLVTFQVMPWGDRATLAGYGVIDLARGEGGSGRVVSVHPEALELVNVAASMVGTSLVQDEAGLSASTTDDDLGLKAELLASAALPLIEVVHDHAGAGENCVSGIVEHVQSLGRLGRAQIRVFVSSGEGDPMIEVAIDSTELHDGLEVALCYSTLDAPLSHPKSMHLLND